VYIGEQLNDLSDENLTWAAQMGVEHIAVNTTHGPGTEAVENPDGTWRVEAILAVKERLARYGLAMDVLSLDLQSTYVTRQRFPRIMLGEPGRDEDIEVIKQNIRAASAAGVPCLKYNLNLMGVPRTGRTPGRGGVTYSHFDYAKWPDHSPAEFGPRPAERVWEAITYFLERVVPVAEEAKVRLACHPHDPGLPPGTTLRGVECVLGSVEGLKRFIEIAPSPYHGLNFCQGTVAEMCADPRREVPEVIRYFGERGKIFMVHFRNIRGRVLNFEEVFPDEGDVDMYQCIKLYRQLGYQGMILPDHVPHSAVDTAWGHRQRSFCLGYIKALIQAAETEARAAHAPAPL
jgi:mannonate dehydratase